VCRQIRAWIAGPHWSILLNWILRSFTPSWLRSSTTDNIDSDRAKICLTRCSKAVYWTLVQYGQAPSGKSEIRSSKSESATRLRTDPSQDCLERRGKPDPQISTYSASLALQPGHVAPSRPELKRSVKQAVRSLSSNPFSGEPLPPRINRLLEIQGETISPHL
jgi:hypothetical protein